MIETATLILTSSSPHLLSAIPEFMPDLRVVTITSAAPAGRIDGRVWCFVDWLLPDVSGLELCRRLRDAPATAHSHITMVLEENDSEARRRALRAGADDYIVGPLTPEILADRLGHYRVSSIGGKAAPRLTHGELSLDLAAHQARWRGKVIVLRPNEFRLLAHFIDHPDQVFTRAGLIAMLGKDGGDIDERTVDVWVGRLRRALKAQGIPDPLRTVRSMGYVLDGIEDENWRQAS